VEKREKRIEIELFRGHWIEVELIQLTDDHEENPTTDDPTLLEGSHWYLSGNYTVSPRKVRIKNEK